MKRIFCMEHGYAAGLLLGGLAAAILSPAWILSRIAAAGSPMGGPLGWGGMLGERTLGTVFMAGVAILAVDLIQMACRARAGHSSEISKATW